MRIETRRQLIRWRNEIAYRFANVGTIVCVLVAGCVLLVMRSKGWLP